MLFSDMPLAPNTRVALRVEYHGGAFNGWQAQTKLDVPTVQEALEAGLSKIAAAPVKPHALVGPIQAFMHRVRSCILMTL